MKEGAMRMLAIVGVVLATSLLPVQAEAQGRGQGQGVRQQGPPFCQNGQGHPVHGRSWCIQKGFGLGRQVWRQVRWDDAVLRGGRRSGDLNRATLGDVLGSVVLSRLDGHRRAAGHRDPLAGRWLRAEDGGAVLQIRAGNAVIAELVDWNRNGRIDLVLLSPVR
jgi:hypothetical protein